ncbi:MAG: ABC transporter ATP-binding protein, partial [Calditrichaeota bacterium]
MKLYLRILRYIRPYWKPVSIGFFFTVTFVFFNAISVWVSADFVRELFTNDNTVQQQTADDSSREQWISSQLQSQRTYDKLKATISALLIQDDKKDTLRLVCIIIFVSFFFKNISNYLHRLFFYYTQMKIVVQLRNELQSKILRLPLSFFHKQHTGALTSIVFNDVHGIQTVLDSSFVKIFLSPLQVVTYLIVLILISWKLTLATFILIPVSGYIIVKIGQSMRRKSRRVLEQISMVVTTFQESISA